MSSLERWNGSPFTPSLSTQSQPSNKLVRKTQDRLAELSADLVVSEQQLEAGAFLAITATTHVEALTTVAEAVVKMHPAAAEGCVRILNAYSTGAADTILRALR